MSRLVIGAHVHPQRFTPGFLKEGERFTYNKLENAIMSELPFDNSRALLADIDRLGIDKACVLTAFAIRNELIYEQMQRYLDRLSDSAVLWTRHAPNGRARQSSTPRRRRKKWTSGCPTASPGSASSSASAG